MEGGLPRQIEGAAVATTLELCTDMTVGHGRIHPVGAQKW